MPKTTTSLRLDDVLRRKVAEAASKEGVSVSALIERLVHEGLVMQAHPGIVFNPGPSGRRATVKSGPDVWEIMSTWRDLEGSEQERIASLMKDYDLKRWQIEAALNYTADHPQEIQDRIELNDRGWQEQDQRERGRSRLLA
jgi:uncharacterized protein (DUF433 family)